MDNLTVEECLKHPLWQHFEKLLETTLWDQLRIMADFLTDAGQIEMAAAYRWFAEEYKAPVFMHGSWGWLKTVYVWPIKGYSIQSEIWVVLKVPAFSDPPKWALYPGIHAAYWAVADAIRSLNMTRCPIVIGDVEYPGTEWVV